MLTMMKRKTDRFEFSSARIARKSQKRFSLQSITKYINFMAEENSDQNKIRYNAYASCGATNM